ncbi:MotA/TolQ/ExbB proton channel family protein [bacterium]|nr:MotA/TolQ/ExbB proton channel family protein [bacterium]MBU1989672.1 MotA/TolQ/ExbB proton channel family protein [bacterium]
MCCKTNTLGVKKIILALLIMSATLFGSSEVQNAYAKEFAFLKAQKEMLKKRVDEIKQSNISKIATAKNEIDKLQQNVLAKESLSQRLSEDLFKSQQNLELIHDDTSLIEAVVSQGVSSLKPYGVGISIQSKDYPKTLQEIFAKSLDLTKELSSLRTVDGEFYLQDGSSQKAKLIKIGNIATYGVSDTVSGALIPAGDNKFKIWSDDASSLTAKALSSASKPQNLNIFIYENANKEIADKEEQTLLNVIDSAGVIGWVIVVLGAIGALFLVLRIVFLQSSTGTKSLPAETLGSLLSKGVDETLEFLKPKKGSTARVLKATIRNIDRDREHIEDIISESIMHESTRLDKLSSTILVIAAVAPLLGLLGTVTGMIATFDIITEFGTGDPKLLSGGIAIALVTTELGLIVAIPLLLGGNLLNSWSESIKDSMEHSALHIVNEYSKQK